MSRTFEIEALVLGIGNILWADEGFGPRAAESFHRTFADCGGVKVMDGGTLGNYLMNEITSSRSILVFDCCDFHAEPGTMRVLRGDEIALWSSTKISPHQTGFNDLLVNATLLGQEPERIAVVGVQPEILDDYGGSLSPKIRALLPRAVELAAEELRAWGFDIQKRTDESVELLEDPSLAMDVYESGRPAADEACRLGDERFLRAGKEG